MRDVRWLKCKLRVLIYEGFAVRSGRNGSYDRFKRVLDYVNVSICKYRAECVGHTDETTDSRQHCEDDQRQRHDPRRFVWFNWTMMIRFRVFRFVAFAKTFLAPEGHHHHSCHVNRSQ